MSFQGELRINYQPKKQYSFSKMRVDRAAAEIVKIVKKNMLSQVKMGNVYEKKRGIFGQRERYVSTRIRIRTTDYFLDTPRVHEYEGDPMPDIWLVHDQKEFNELFGSLKTRCLSEGITVEIVKSAALHDDSLEYLFSSAC